MKDDDSIEKPVMAEKEEPGGLVLTPRERQCIAEALQGKDVLQIAKELKITSNTVFYYLNSIQIKIYRLSQQALQLADTQSK